MKYTVLKPLYHESKDYRPGDTVEFEKDDKIAEALEVGGSIVSEEAVEKAKAEAEKAAAKRTKADAPAS